MQELANSLIDSGVQCWTCPVFDNLFAIISNTAAAAYQRLCIFSVVIFCVLFAFYALNVVWNNIKNGGQDSLFSKNLRLPAYENAIQLAGNGFFNPELRDTIIQILETSVANFQVYIKIGIAIIDEAFSLSALLGIGALIKHIIICFIGIFLTYNFAKLFIKYSFCFMDIIFAMAMFAFFFPLSVVLFIFRGANDVPGWMANLGKNLGGGQIKKLINAIVSVASTILTYTVIMLVIRGFLDANAIDTDSIKNTTEALFDFDLENSSAMQITLAGAIVLVYVINYIADQIPKVTEKILSIFNVQQEDKLSKEMGENVFQLTQIIANKTKEIAKTIINPESADKEKKDK